MRLDSAINFPSNSSLFQLANKTMLGRSTLTQLRVQAAVAQGEWECRGELCGPVACF